MAWLGPWAKRRQLSIVATDVDEDLTDLPIKVLVSASAGKTSVDVSGIFDDLGANKLKIAFTQSDGTTQLYAEIVFWDNTGEVTEIWVKVPSLLAASGGTIYMYWDATQADNTTYVGAVNSTPGANVWNSNYLAVWHFAETTGNYLDSTSNNRDSTSVDVSDRSASGAFGGVCPEFDEASNDDIQFPSISGPLNHTIEVYALTDTVSSGYNAILNHGSGNPANWYQLGRNGNEWHYRWIGNDLPNRRMDFGTLSTGIWYHLAGTWDQDTDDEAIGYVDGAQVGYTASTSNATASSHAISVGRGISDTEDWDGRIEEVRISDIARSAAWIDACHKSCMDNFYTWGAEETEGWGHIINGVIGGKVNEVPNSNITKINEV